MKSFLPAKKVCSSAQLAKAFSVWHNVLSKVLTTHLFRAVLPKSLRHIDKLLFSRWTNRKLSRTEQARLLMLYQDTLKMMEELAIQTLFSSKNWKTVRMHRLRRDQVNKLKSKVLKITTWIQILTCRQLSTVKGSPTHQIQELVITKSYPTVKNQASNRVSNATWNVSHLSSSHVT